MCAMINGLDIPEGPWCCERSQLDWLVTLSRAARSTPPAKAQSMLRTRRKGPLAIVEVLGGLMIADDQATPMTDLLGFVRYGELIAAIDKAAGDWRIRTILLHLETHGGTTAGLDGVIDAVIRARKVKRVQTASERFLLGAGYILAAHTDHITGGSACRVGGIVIHRFVGVDELKQIEQGPARGTDAMRVWWGNVRSELDPKFRVHGQVN
jgi:ClpP class serine protease